MMAGLASRPRHISICEWVSSAPLKIGGIWSGPQTQESAQLLILMAELNLVRRSASARFWMELHISVRIGRSTPNTAIYSPTRIWLLPPFWLQAWGLEDGIKGRGGINARRTHRT